MKRVEKAWGYEIWWADVPGKYLGKILHINAGHRFSLQYHEKKDETMYILKGKALVQISRNRTLKYTGDCIHIPHQTLHRVEAIEELDIIEVSTYFPTDVVRVEDDYNRTQEL